FSAGYLKKSGSVAEEQADKASVVASLKTGAIGVKVMIMHPDIQLPDKIKIKEQEVDKKVQVEVIKEEKTEEKTKKKETKPRKVKKKEKEEKKEENATNQEK
ncbi:MAG: hypothetical protein QXR60_04395, partial [Candidatus Nanoarchaeia archaeon]